MLKRPLIFNGGTIQRRRHTDEALRGGRWRAKAAEGALQYALSSDMRGGQMFFTPSVEE